MAPAVSGANTRQREGRRAASVIGAPFGRSAGPAYWLDPSGSASVIECLDICRRFEDEGRGMSTGHQVAMLGTGLIGDFYTMTLHGQRGRDRVEVVYSRSEERGAAFRQRWAVPVSTTSIEEAVGHPDVDTVVVGLPNHMHEEAVAAAAAAGKAVLVTKPLARNAEEARRILDTVERAGGFGGYLEDLVYTPKT